jgi:hypothetical protein
MELRPEGVENLVENIEAYLALDASEDGEYQDGLRRLRAIQMVFDDLLVAEGRREPLTPIERQSRQVNTYYRPVGILPSEGNSP